MNVEFNTEKLEQALNAFYRLTKVTITLFDCNLVPVCSVGEWQNYCLAIGESEERLAICEACNKSNAKKSEKSEEPWIYPCHAGIAEGVVPFRIGEQIVAYLMIGKFRDADKIYSSEGLVQSAAERYRLETEKMLSAYYELPLLDKNALDSIITIFKALICYIRDQGAIRTGTPLSQDIEKYINVHFRERITIKSLCLEFGLNRSSLCALIKQNFNETLLDHIRNKRIQHAKYLLANTDMPLQEIINDTGIQSYQYFYKVFRKETGMSPEQYRKQNKK